MTHTISAFLVLMLAQAPTSSPQAPASPQRGATTPTPTAPQTPAPQRGTQPAQPQRGQRATAKPPMPMTLRQVIEQLIALKNSSRVEDQVSKAGVRFQATPAVLDILKEFGAGPRLLSLIPPPPPTPAPPAAKVAGPLTVICDPKDCMVAAGETFKGMTSQNRTTITGLKPGETTVEVFADGYEHITRKVQLEEGKPAEETFSLKRSMAAVQQSGSATLLKTVTTLGGIDGFAQLADIEGSGTMQWVNADGKMEEWALTFSKRVGRDFTATFKTKNGECTASLVAQAAKQDCKGGLRNSGEKIAEQGTSLFLSYQLQDVIQTLMKRPLVASEANENHLESSDVKDAYIFVVDKDSLPVGLIYRIADNNSPIQVEYSNYLKVSDARYPGKVSIGRVNTAPVWIFTLNNVRSRIARRQ